jgi:hypothetical protein
VGQSAGQFCLARVRLGAVVIAATKAMNFGDWAGAIQNLVAIAAIGIGGAWGYYKFVQGRTFHRRAEVTLEPSLLAGGSWHGIQVRATLRNTGGSEIILLAKGVEIFSFAHGDTDEMGRPQWREIAAAPLFDDHDWIESQETIVDEVLVPLGVGQTGEDVVAYRLACLVYGEHERKGRRFWAKPKGGIRWTTNAVVPAVAEVDADNRAKASQGGTVMAEEQSNADDKEITRQRAKWSGGAGTDGPENRKVQDDELRQKEASQAEIDEKKKKLGQ